jgi:hypothetical protein
MPDGRAHLLAIRQGLITPCDDPEGWPEFTVTLAYYVESDDPATVQRQRQYVVEFLSEIEDASSWVKTSPEADRPQRARVEDPGVSPVGFEPQDASGGEPRPGGIVSEGGPAQAPNPRGMRPDTPPGEDDFERRVGAASHAIYGETGGEDACLARAEAALEAAGLRDLLIANGDLGRALGNLTDALKQAEATAREEAALLRQIVGGYNTFPARDVLRKIADRLDGGSDG